MIKYCIKYIKYFCLCSCLSGCITSIEYRKHQETITNAMQNNNFDAVKQVIEKPDFHKEEQSIFLKNAETANYLFNTENYCQALDFFDKSYDNLQAQQTTDISSKLSSFFLKELDVYNGEIYEKSLIRFYQSLTNYNIYNNGKCEVYLNLQNHKKDGQNVGLSGKILSDAEKRQKFSASRANILEWDSFLEGREIKKEDRFFSKDLLQKIWGAFIHEQQGSLTDKQIATQLYKDAKDVAKNRYAVYSEFNKNSKEFIENLDKIESKKLFLDYDNKYVKDVVDFADKQIKRLQENKKANLEIVLFDDVISQKKAVQANIPTRVFFNGNNLLLYAANTIMATNVSFETPFIEQKPIENEYFYRIKDKKKNKIIIEDKIILVEPISNIEYTSYLQNRDSIIAGIVSRITSNFNSCIISAIMQERNRKNRTNKKKSSSNNFFGSLLSFAVETAIDTAIDTAVAYLFTEGNVRRYSVAIRRNCLKILTDTERVDTRHLVSLPSNIFIATDYLEDGEYNIEIIKNKRGNNTIIKTEDFVIKDGNTFFLKVNSFYNKNYINNDNTIIQNKIKI